MTEVTEVNHTAAPELARDHEWQRLDPRMLFVYPIREVLRFLPVLAGVFIAGSASGGGPWHLIGLAIALVLGVLRYLTTSFRIADGRVELKRGLLSRHVLATPLDRVRTVDLTSSPIHRVLGLTTVRIGTGLAHAEGGEKLDLDGLPVARAHELRRELMGAVSTSLPEGVSPEPALVAFDVSWLRFAPFTGAGLIVVAAVVGALSQVFSSLDLWDDVNPLAWALPIPLTVVAIVTVLAVLLLVVAISVTGYLITNWNFALTREAGAWHVSRGLLTTRETSLDEARVAGVVLGEPLALRLTGGRHLLAIVTGINQYQLGSSTLVPPSTHDIAPRVAATVLGSALPVTATLTGHGAAAERRRRTRAIVPALLAPLAAVVLLLTGGPWWPLVPAGLIVLAAGALAADRISGLGHALADGYLVARSGSLARRREALRVGDIIGWNLRATWFQRRVGLTTLVATTAGGRGSVTVLDVPEDEALRLACNALPHLANQFLAHEEGGLGITARKSSQS